MASKYGDMKTANETIIAAFKRAEQQNTALVEGNSATRTEVEHLRALVASLDADRVHLEQTLARAEARLRTVVPRAEADARRTTAFVLARKALRLHNAHNALVDRHNNLANEAGMPQQATAVAFPSSDASMYSSAAATTGDNVAEDTKKPHVRLLKREFQAVADVVSPLHCLTPHCSTPCVVRSVRGAGSGKRCCAGASVRTVTARARRAPGRRGNICGAWVRPGGASFCVAL